MSPTTTQPRHTESFAEGSLIAGRFTMERVLGSGGFATVYRATQVGLNRSLALKLLHTRVEQSPGFYERFKQEAQIAAGINHPNIVSIYDYGFIEASQQPYIAMELLEGHTLEHELSTNGALRPERALALLIPCLDALGEGHARGIIHKDLKPSNLFLVHPGHPIKEALVVTDYGIARIQSGDQPGHTKTGEFLGTPQYLAPEYLKGEPIDTSFDVYQMGLILVEMLTGKAVVDFDDTYPCLLAHMQGNLDVPEPLLAGPLGEVIRRATCLDPQERFRDAHAMRDALTALAQAQPSPLAPSPGHSPAPSASRRTTPEPTTPEPVAPRPTTPEPVAPGPPAPGAPGRQEGGRGTMWLIIGVAVGLVVLFGVCGGLSLLGLVATTNFNDEPGGEATSEHLSDTNSVRLKVPRWSKGDSYTQTDRITKTLQASLFMAIPSGQVVEEARSSRKYTIRATRKGQPTRVLVTYKRKQVETTTPEDNAVNTSPLEGGSYLLETRKGSFTVRSRSNARVSDAEEQEVRADHASFGEADEFTAILPKRAIAVGERLELSREAAEKAFGVEGTAIRVERFAMTLDRLQRVNGVQVAVFASELGITSREENNGVVATSQATLNGPITFEVKTGRPVSIRMDGPLQIQSGVVTGTGRMEFDFAREYH